MPTIALPGALSMEGRRAVVTGAASGIGKATALVLAQLGAEVVIIDRAPMGETMDGIQAAGGICTVMQGDLTDDAFIARFFAGARVHAVAHCAAILAEQPWTEDAGWHERFHRVMDINVRVPLQLTAAAIEHMAAHGGGNIALVGSVAGKTGGTSLTTPPDYAASKGALHTLVKWLSRNAVGRGVLVNGGGARAGGDANDPGVQSGADTADGADRAAGGTGLADRVPLHLGCELFVGGHSGCERRRVCRAVVGPRASA
jgi:3-oxoacyl-[acyl-carrier protein] reductase